MKKENEKIKTIIVERRKSNGLGIAGFILSLIGLLSGLVNLISIVSIVLGLILSFFGLFSKPKGFAIAGFIISIICLALIILLGTLILNYLEETGLDRFFL